ncbi:MAG: tetratricopeptide repeat protein [Lysobacteraceae bacterium]|nr:MAG: tetratricopeptide repeat protein [Xanthomonadaceae bacterium]
MPGMHQDAQSDQILSVDRLSSTVRALTIILVVTSASWCRPTLAEARQSACNRIERHAIPDRSWCQRRFASRGGDALRKEADARIHAGDFEMAEQALACATEAESERDWRGRYETMRLYGVLEYRRERIDAALTGFECALEIAERHQDRPGIAKQTKNIGAALLRLGDYGGAQAALERSLAIQRADRNPEIGSALNNLADLYRQQNDPETALHYYREAIEAYRRNGEAIEAAHTLETMSVIALDRKDVKTATGLLERALEDYRSEGHRPMRLRVYAGLVRAALIDGDTRTARRWSTDGLALSAEHGLMAPAALQLQIARLERAEGRARAAAMRLRGALEALSPNDPDRIALLEEHGLALADAGLHAEATIALREAAETQRHDAQARFDRQIAWQRSRFEAAERDRTIATLAHENRQKRLILWLGAVSVLALSFAIGMVLLRWRQRARVEEAVRRARYEEALQRYRSEADALQIDRRLLRALLATREEAVCLLDADGRILAANQMACGLLHDTESELVGRPLAERLALADREVWLRVLDGIEDGPCDAMRLRTINERTLHATVTQWEQDAGILLLALFEAEAVATGPVRREVATVSGTEDAVAQPAEGQDSNAIAAIPQPEARLQFRCDLVELMLAAIEHWEISTGTSRIELAERSRLWRIGIDDGRLRARTMERYLALSKLPQNPRWRDVLRTVYYVLEHCPIDPALHSQWQRRVDSVQKYGRRSALLY